MFLFVLMDVLFLFSDGSVKRQSSRFGLFCDGDVDSDEYIPDMTRVRRRLSKGRSISSCSVTSSGNFMEPSLDVFVDVSPDNSVEPLPENSVEPSTEDSVEPSPENSVEPSSGNFVEPLPDNVVESSIGVQTGK